MPAKNLSRIFDMDANGTVVLFHELWNDNYRLKSPLDFYHFPTSLLLGTLPAMVVMHTSLSHLFKKLIYYRNLPPFQHARNFHEDVCTFLSPPVHLDWELLYRGSNLTVGECWNRSTRLLAAYSILILIEHLVLMVPLILFGSAIVARNSFLSINFPPSAEEEISTHMVTVLLSVGIAGFTALPFFELFFAYVYFKKWHAWSRVLNSTVA